jgi:hypothetical protein
LAYKELDPILKQQNFKKEIEEGNNSARITS